MSLIQVKYGTCLHKDEGLEMKEQNYKLLAIFLVK